MEKKCYAIIYAASGVGLPAMLESVAMRIKVDVTRRLCKDTRRCCRHFDTSIRITYDICRHRSWYWHVVGYRTVCHAAMVKIRVAVAAAYKMRKQRAARHCPPAAPMTLALPVHHEASRARYAVVYRYAV